MSERTDEIIQAVRAALELGIADIEIGVEADGQFQVSLEGPEGDACHLLCDLGELELVFAALVGASGKGTT